MSYIKKKKKNNYNQMKGIARCVKLDKKISDTLDLILLSTIEFNKTNHSVTNIKSVELIRSNNVETGLQVTNRLVKEDKSY